ncbi:MAG: T9SS type A sorting domain-containing protein, partial [Flavobacteriales bacterium]|nr:T9SS type A sorting domain-containing protein [Flavobacteriales bacterium]
TTIGASNFEWYLDGELISTEENPAIEFPNSGAFTLYLIASNAECGSQSDLVNVVVGNCSTGNEANLWYFQLESGSIHGFDFGTEPPTTLPEMLIPNDGHSKSSICDADGNLLFISTGVRVYGADNEILENGTGLLGHASSHYGTLFVKKPSSSNEYYLFYNGADANNFASGIYYSIIDADANGGLGAVTEVKNIAVENAGAEPITAIRHCNLRDFWLVFYDVPEEAYKAYLVTPSGMANDPVISSIVHPDDVSTIAPLRVNAQGTKIAHKSLLLGFDGTTGTVSLEHTFDFDLSVAYDWSPSGRYLYQSTGQFENTFWQIDTDLPAAEMQDAAYTWDFGSIGNFKFYVHRAPDGRIYMEEALQGKITVVNNPNLSGEAVDIDEDVYQANTLINSFGNYFHAYLDGQALFLDGPTTVCLSDAVQYGVQGAQCLLDIVEWEVEGDATWSNAGDGTVSVEFESVGQVTLIATLETECGVQTETFLIDVIEAPELELGPDMPICEGIPVVLSAGPGFDEYNWSTNETSESIIISAPGVYSVTASVEGCTANDFISITETISGTIDLGPDFDMCEGDVIVLDVGDDWVDPVWQDGTVGSTYTVYEGGSYTVTAQTPCQATDTVEVDDCGKTITDVEDLTPSPVTATIFPNPNTGQFDVVLTGSRVEPQALSIHNAMGQLVFNKANILASDDQRTSFNLDLAPGVYMLSAVNQRSRQVVRFVVQ